MSLATLKSILRPLRIAFVIPPWDRAAALEAMQINSLLWGGSYNPIIPLHRRLNRSNPFFDEAHSAKDVFKGYLNAYDPDFVVRLGNAKTTDIDLGNHSEITTEDILQDLRSSSTPGHGISIFEILDHLLHEEFRFVRRHEVSIDIPQCGEDLFLTSVFGDVPQEFSERLDQFFQEFPDYQMLPCAMEEYAHFLRSENLFLRRINENSINFSPARRKRDCVFLLDDSKVEDVVFYWNLRALGWRILPVPVSSMTAEPVLRESERFVERNYHSYRSNPSLFNHTTVLKGPTVTNKAHESFAESLQLTPKNPTDLLGKFTRQHWIPRIWNLWDRQRNQARRDEIEVLEEKVELDTDEEYFHPQVLLPEFADPRGGYGGPRCANNIEVRAYGEASVYAEVIPQGGKAMNDAIGLFMGDSVRCSSSGLVFYPTFPRSTLRLKLPEAEYVFQAWFEERGWNVELSDNGHIVKHILKQFGGLWSTRMLTNEPVLKLLYSIANNKWLNEREFRRRLNQCANQVGYLEADNLAKRLIENNIVKLGIELSCPQCRQSSWYSVSEAEYEVDCHQCLQQYALPSHSTKEIKWAYRGNGAFTSRHGEQGGLAVLLTLGLFAESTQDRITSMLSFNARKDEQEAEVDLALLISRARFGDAESGILFVECKSYNHFEKRDIERMANFAQQFPQAAIVVSTLRRELTAKEIRMLTPIAKQGWKSKLNGKPATLLIILTGNELFSHVGPRATWKSLGGKFAKFGNWHYDNDENETLAEITQSLYLDFSVTDFVRRHRSQRDKSMKIKGKALP